MNKIRLGVDIIAMTAGVIGCGLAYLQYQENKQIRQVSVNVQSALFEESKDGSFDIETINLTIGKLGSITGINPEPIHSSTNPKAPEARQMKVETLSASAEPELKRGELRLDEGSTLDLFKEGLMYTVVVISEDEVELRDASSQFLSIQIGERQKIPGSECSVDLIKTHPDMTYKKKGWAELRTWCA